MSTKAEFKTGNGDRDDLPRGTNQIVAYLTHFYPECVASAAVTTGARFYAFLTGFKGKVINSATGERASMICRRPSGTEFIQCYPYRDARSGELIHPRHGKGKQKYVEQWLSTQVTVSDIIAALGGDDALIYRVAIETERGVMVDRSCDGFGGICFECTVRELLFQLNATDYAANPHRFVPAPAGESDALLNARAAAIIRGLIFNK